MADAKITDLTSYTPPIDTDVLPIVDITAVATKKITWANIKAALKTYFDSLTTTLTNKTLTSPVINTAVTGTAGFNAWTSFTPTLTNITIGNGTNSAYYSQVGKRVMAHYWFKMGSTTSVTGAMKFGFPVTAVTNPQTAVWPAVLLDAGTAYFHGCVTQASSTALDLQATTTNATYATLGGTSSTVPFTWAVNDEVFFYVFYEAA